ncbi:hypothetical protein Bpfe_012404 [Biomphalaria pfeifferi]|uniref:Uncharacterized protein n=1 Tax=Biomphalaria pfeifferi TaxID=112525 RepID=A0AAD8BQM6_BIOPF|nr:CAunnamed protein product [Biomphalaria glabrata]KAI8796816.1 CAunnamed protein product [Biomphalaria glabrata]KAK0058080.1 hypothetical protein Bpfe_012404 [Biomphalaria pfeifferi]
MLLRLFLQSLILVAIIGFIHCLPGWHRRSTELMYGHYGPGSHCEVNGELIAHSHTFVDPTMSKCLQYQCIFGTSFIISEACEDGSHQCHAVGDEWEEKCVTYTCTKTTIDGYNYFQPIVRNAKCQGAEGSCHEPGDLFSYRLHGRLLHNCKCNITDNSILYRCI